MILHNRYRHPGGEDAVALREFELLRRYGVDVIRHEVSNDTGGALETLNMAAHSSWSSESYATVRKLCGEYRPDVVHVHNFWMKLSPSVHAACRDSGALTVQTLHNYRLLCVNGVFMRAGTNCEDCLGKIPWRGVTRRCKDNSFLASAAVARMIVWNRRWGTWDQEVDAFITPSRHVRTKMIAGGLPSERISVKPNFTDDPGCAPASPAESNAAIFVGRLSDEKGLGVLLDAWAGTGRRLWIVGDGPAREALEKRNVPGVSFTGHLPQEDVKGLLMASRFVLLPSLCAESFGNSVVEAFSCGRPAIVTDLGGQGELVEHGVTGFKVAPGDAGALAKAIGNCFASDSGIDRMGINARAEFLARYTPERNFEALMNIYESNHESIGEALHHDHSH